MSFNQPAEKDIYSGFIRLENKDLFIDARHNRYGPYVKISEKQTKYKNNSSRQTILIPYNSLKRLQAALQEAADRIEEALQDGQLEVEVDHREITKTPVPGVVYLKNIPWDSTEEGLKTTLLAALKTTDSSIITSIDLPQKYHHSLGYALVNLSDDKYVKDAVEAWDKLDIGREIEARQYFKKA